MITASPYARRTDRRAFTLMEALAVLVFIGIVIPAILGAVSMATRAASSTTHRIEATLLAEAKLEEILATASWKDGAAEGEFLRSASGELLRDDRATNPPAYRWQLIREDGPDVTLRQLRLRVIWEHRNSERWVELVTLVEDTE